MLRDVTFSIDEGEFVYIIGKVGSGKSSLIKTLYGELPIHAGEAHVMEYDMTTLRRKHLPELRRKLGIIFQDFQLLTDRPVDANLRFVLRATGWKDKTEIDNRIAEVLTLVGMETKGYKLPSELSGGEQQRIAIARAILNNPKLILADEPTGNLDAETSRLITELLRKVVHEQGVTVVMITHNLHLVERYPGRVFECKNKALMEIKHPSRVMNTLQAEIGNENAESETDSNNAADDIVIIEDIESIDASVPPDDTANDTANDTADDICQQPDANETDKEDMHESKERSKDATADADFEIIEDLVEP